MNRTVHGIVRGRTIELAEELDVAEGQQVEIQVSVVEAAKDWGEGLARAAGGLAAEWTEEDDQILDGIYEDRKRDSRREITE